MTFHFYKEFEQKLNEIDFFGANLGSLIAQYLFILHTRSRNNYKLGGKEQAKFQYIRWFEKYFGLRGFNSNKEKIALPKNKHLVYISDLRLLNLSLPIIEELSSNEVIILCQKPDILAKINEDYNKTNLHVLPKVELKNWRKKYREKAPKIERLIKEFLKKVQLHENLTIEVSLVIQQKSQLFLIFKKWLCCILPKSVLVDFDRGIDCASLVNAANSLGIPTFTQVHGVINDGFGYVPPAAMKVFVWGEVHKEQFLNYGVDESRLIISGAPQFKHLDSTLSQNDIKLKLNIRYSQSVILLATSLTNDENRKQLAMLFIESLEGLSNIKGIIKLHPSEKRSFYEKIVKNNRDILICEKDELAFEEAFVLSDLICVNRSGFGLDAGFRKVPFICLSIDDSDLGFGKVYENEGIPTFRSKGELNNFFQNYFYYKKKLPAELLSKVDFFTKRNVSASGKAAAKTVKDIVKALKVVEVN